MNLLPKSTLGAAAIGCVASLWSCVGSGVDDSQNAVIDPPSECSPERPDCSISFDFPTQADLTPENSSGIRFSEERGGLVIDRISALPDEDADGVPDAADECLGQPGFREPCDGDASDDGIFRTLFFDDSGTNAALRRVIVPVTADVPRIDIYFLVDASMTMRGELVELQTNIATIVDDVEMLFSDVRFGLGIARQYPAAGLAGAESQAPYHHVVDLTSDTVLFAKGIDALNELDRNSQTSALTQALHAVATGQGLASFVPNRIGCPAGETGYPCFRPDALRVVLTLTDSEVANGPRGVVDYMFAPEPANDLRPPVRMFPALLDADDEAAALDLGDLSAGSLTLMGMTTTLTNSVSTNLAVGCDATGAPPMMSLDTEDAVITFRFDASTITDANALSDYTHFSSNLALFDMMPIDPASVVLCNGGDLDMMPPDDPMFWGRLSWMPVTSQQYYLVIDGKTSGMDPMEEQRGPFQLEISHDDDPGPSPGWLTVAAPVSWNDVETALLAERIRVASVVSDRAGGNDAEADAREIASATGAVTRIGEQWVGTAGMLGEGLDAAVINTVARIAEDSGFDIEMTEEDNAATPFDETAFVQSLTSTSCATNTQEFANVCESQMNNRCSDCEPGAPLEFTLDFLNDSVAPTATAQVFDFELVVVVDGQLELERIPVRVLVPDASSHEFEPTPEANFYRNTYDSVGRCRVPPERPSWGMLNWVGNTPGDSTIEFQIRSADTEAELDTMTPVSVVITSGTVSTQIDLRTVLISAGIPDGLLYLRVTAVLNPSPNLLSTPELNGWDFEFTCFAAE